jgi:hypothetical protein
MANINHIVKGTVNNILNKEVDLYNERIKICKECKLYLATGIVGPICNPNLYLNTKTNEISKTAKIGFKRGCGCLLASKTRVKETKCLLNKW